MLEERGRITELLKRIASFQEYTFLQQMNKYAQDRFILSYEKFNGGNETIEVEINYMLRVPLYKPVMNKAWMLFDKFEVPAVVNLSLEEICAGKFSALLFRATPRDLFDSVEIIKNIERLDYSLFRSAFIFYCSIQAEEFETAKKRLYKKISNHDIKTQLLQTLDQHPEVWQEGFAAVFATVLRPQLEGLDAVSAVGRFLIQLVVKEGKLREEFFSGVDLEWHNRTVELVTQPPTELEEVTLDCSY